MRISQVQKASPVYLGKDIPYVYGDSNWGDKLTSYNGTTITYDSIGNPKNYRDGMSLGWKNGRQLYTYSGTGNKFAGYDYDASGTRVSKGISGQGIASVTYKYEYVDGKLLYESRGEKSFHYSYDAYGYLSRIHYKLPNDSTSYVYYVIHNASGDVIALYDSNGALSAKYEYDDWGNVLSIKDGSGSAITDPNHVGNLNPIRYRGYYQDQETNLYYLMIL